VEWGYTCRFGLLIGADVVGDEKFDNFCFAVINCSEKNAFFAWASCGDLKIRCELRDAGIILEYIRTSPLPHLNFNFSKHSAKHFNHASLRFPLANFRKLADT